jgi:hypothetical protein
MKKRLTTEGDMRWKVERLYQKQLMYYKTSRAFIRHPCYHCIISPILAIGLLAIMPASETVAPWRREMIPDRNALVLIHLCLPSSSRSRLIYRSGIDLSAQFPSLMVRLSSDYGVSGSEDFGERGEP